jgi:hypothetical protein
MKCKHTIIILQLIPLICLAFFTNGVGAATVEWEIINTLNVEAAALDLALSPDGKQLFVLTDNGDILIYSSGSAPTHKIRVGPQFDQIKLGSQGDILILNSRINKNVQLIRLDFIQNINVSGSPFKGAGDAPVVVAVFNDFE